MIRTTRALFAALLCAALFACGGEGAATGEDAVNQGNGQQIKQDDQPGDKDDGIACAEIYAPVCSVELQNIQCITTPCPVGFHKTFPNRCQSDAAKALFLSEGECGELEGQPYYEDKPDDGEPIACTKEYNPVCAAETSIEPCTTLPCPVMQHKTFGNPCMARAAKARIVQEGECGKLEGTPVTQFEGACPAVHDPVCGKDEGQIACITQPCPTHQYKTFGNGCEASLSRAAVVLDDQCGKLEGAIAFADPPVRMVEKLPTTEKSVAIDKASIDGDRLFVRLGYSGCGEQHFDLYINSAFMESHPVQVKYEFVPQVEDLCLAVFATEFSYDLIPLKHAYQEAYQSETGSISLPGIGVYEF